MKTAVTSRMRFSDAMNAASHFDVTVAVSEREVSNARVAFQGGFAEPFITRTSKMADPDAWIISCRGWGDELRFTEDGAKELADRLRTIDGTKEPTITPLYAEHHLSEARALALEEAAKVAENTIEPNPSLPVLGMNVRSELIAFRIRALNVKPGKRGEE